MERSRGHDPDHEMEKKCQLACDNFRALRRKYGGLKNDHVRLAALSLLLPHS